MLVLPFDKYVPALMLCKDGRRAAKCAEWWVGLTMVPNCVVCSLPQGERVQAIFLRAQERWLSHA